MKSPHSEDTSSSATHSENLQRELSALIAHIQSDRKRVDDARFCDLLDKSAEILKRLHTLFERFGPESGGERQKPSRADAKKADGAARARAPQSKSDEKKGKGAAVPRKRAKAAPAESMPLPKREDPAAVTARVQLQRKEARAPKMPRGPAAPKPAPPESGKPIWRTPHSA